MNAINISKFISFSIDPPTPPQNSLGYFSSAQIHIPSGNFPTSFEQRAYTSLVIAPSRVNGKPASTRVYVSISARKYRAQREKVRDRSFVVVCFLERRKFRGRQALGFERTGAQRLACVSVGFDIRSYLFFTICRLKNWRRFFSEFLERDFKGIFRKCCWNIRTM